MRIASSYESTRYRPATGPNTSSDHIRMSGVMSATTVGGYHQPGRSGRDPPQRTLAPLATASATSSSTSVRPDSVASGPTSVASSMGSPTANADMLATNASVNSSYTSECTMNRLAAMQDWPLFWQRAVVATAAAVGMSAEGITTNGSLPPSSSTIFLRTRPAIAATDRPAASLPVSVAARTRGSDRIPSTSPLPTSSVVNAPSGKPARANTSCMYSAVCGTFDACLSSPTLPAISAGAANRIACHSGKFHGITASTGPSGKYRPYAVVAPTATGSAGSSARYRSALAA